MGDTPETDSNIADNDRAFWQAVSGAGAIYRWILASLVSLNGGAIIALGDWHTQISPDAFRSAVSCFFLGCVLAVIGAANGALTLLVIGTNLRTGHWVLGSRGSGKNKTNGRDLIRGVALALGIAFNGFSLAAFSLGGAAVIDGLPKAANTLQSKSEIERVRSGSGA